MYKIETSGNAAQKAGLTIKFILDLNKEDASII